MEGSKSAEGDRQEELPECAWWGVHARGGSLTFSPPRPRLGRPGVAKPALMLTPPGPGWDLMALQSLWTQESAAAGLTQRKFWENVWLAGTLSSLRARDLLTWCVLGGNWGLGSNVGRRPSPLQVSRETWGPVGALHRKYSKQEQTEVYEGVRSSYTEEASGSALAQGLEEREGSQQEERGGGWGWGAFQDNPPSFNSPSMAHSITHSKCRS